MYTSLAFFEYVLVFDPLTVDELKRDGLGCTSYRRAGIVQGRVTPAVGN